MSASIQEVFNNELNKWINQPWVDLREYELIPLNIPWSSVTLCGIDGVLWTQSDPTQQLQNVAGRFLYDGGVYKWIVPGNSMTEGTGNAMIIPGGVKISGGVREHGGLSSALTKIHEGDLKQMSFKIPRSMAQFSVAITVQQIATYILRGKVLVYDK